MIPFRNLPVLALVLPTLLFSGCASDDHRSQPVKRSIRTVELPGGIKPNSEDDSTFRNRLDEVLYEDDFVRGNDFTIEWKVVKYDRGNRALRYLVGFGAGKGYFNVETRLMDDQNRVLRSQQAEGSQTMGIGGGSFESAVREAAENIAEIAVQTVYPGR